MSVAANTSGQERKIKNYNHTQNIYTSVQV